MLAVLQELDDVLGRLSATDSWALSNDDVGTALDMMAAAEARLAAVKLGVVGDADGRNIGVCEATSTAGWLRGRLLMHPGEARRTVKLAKRIADAVSGDGGGTGHRLDLGSPCADDQSGGRWAAAGRSAHQGQG